MRVGCDDVRLSVVAYTPGSRVRKMDPADAIGRFATGPIDRDYDIDRERQFDLAPLRGLPSAAHDGLIPNFNRKE
jgi:hypothetical protein